MSNDSMSFCVPESTPSFNELITKIIVAIATLTGGIVPKWFFIDNNICSVDKDFIKYVASLGYVVTDERLNTSKYNISVDMVDDGIEMYIELMKLAEACRADGDREALAKVEVLQKQAVNYIYGLCLPAIEHGYRRTFIATNMYKQNSNEIKDIEDGFKSNAYFQFRQGLNKHVSNIMTGERSKEEIKGTFLAYLLFMMFNASAETIDQDLHDYSCNKSYLERFFERASDRYEAENGHRPDEKELAAYTGKSVGTIRRTKELANSRNLLFLDKTVSEENDTVTTFGDTVASQGISIEDKVLEEDFHERFMQDLKKVLDDFTYEVVLLTYDFLGYGVTMSTYQIAEYFIKRDDKLINDKKTLQMMQKRVSRALIKAVGVHDAEHPEKNKRGLLEDLMLELGYGLAV